MSRGEQIRIVIYTVMLFIFVYFSIGYSYEVYGTGSALSNPSGTHEIVVDNEDFTPLVMLFGYGINGFLSFFMQGMYAIIILIVSVLFILPFRLIGLNKKRKITQKEYAIYKDSFIGIFGLALMISAILTRFTGLLTIFLYNGIWAVFVWLFVLLPAKKLVKSSDVQ
ncbi:MAG: hypothetical protein NC089_00155 [Bacteroides sp.]|nr:hypothetical protein [Bacteroides sp.]MCM1549376.1 hypothetical protein [Clostridium sp.]